MTSRRVGAPMGLTLSASAKVVSRAFDARLVDASDSLPVWPVCRAPRSWAPGASWPVRSGSCPPGRQSMINHIAVMVAVTCAAGSVLPGRWMTRASHHLRPRSTK